MKHIRARRLTTTIASAMAFLFVLQGAIPTPSQTSAVVSGVRTYGPIYNDILLSSAVGNQDGTGG